MRLFWRRKKLTSLDRLLKKVAANDSELRHVDLDPANKPSHLKVNLDDKDIGDKGAKRLAEALRDNTVVTYLNLGSNNISAAGARALAEILKHNSSITKIRLYGNHIGDEGATALAEVLEVNSSVSELYLGRNGISDVGARALAEALCHNSSVTTLDLDHNRIGDAGKRELEEMLQVNSSITKLILSTRWSFDDVSDEHKQRVDDLAEINSNARSREEACRLKTVCKIGWLLESEVATEAAAVELALDHIGSFPQADQRRGLFEKLLGLPERGADVAASVDVATARTLYQYAAECGAAPTVLMNVLRAHESICTYRDVKHQLYPFMHLATMTEAGAGDVLELLLLNPNLVESGIVGPVNQFD